MGIWYKMSYIKNFVDGEINMNSKQPYIIKTFELKRRDFLVGSTAMMGCSIAGVPNNNNNDDSASTQITDTSEIDDTKETEETEEYCENEVWNQDGSYDPASCDLTGSDIEGPFHLPNAPFRNNFDLYGDSGTTLILQGQLFQQDTTNCRVPINGTIDFWHADPSGNYDNTSTDMKYRGLVQTDANGFFELTTLLPGRYLNGSLYRPRHIHVKIYDQNNQEVLTTQLYFEGDPYLPCDSFASTSRVLPYSGDEQNGMTVSNLVFVISQ